MKADISRDSFDPTKQYMRVLMQQGRVLLDADWNEQVSILLHHMQTMAEDLIGPHGGPQHRCGFEVTLPGSGNNLRIGTGRYYVDGIPCQNDTTVSYASQPYPESKELRDKSYLIYLKTWERHVTALQDGSIREEALGGADTTTRSQVVWQVKALALDEEETEEESGWLEELLEDIFGAEEPARPAERAYQLLKEKRIDRQSQRAKMAASLPGMGYRGATENQLYRVEIHDGGTFGRSTPTIKWARDNACVVFPIVSLRGSTAEVEHLGEDSGSPLTEGDWVEIADRETVSQDDLLPLLQVESIDRVGMTVTLTVPDDTELPVYEEDSDEHPFLRRWHSRGTLPIEEPDSEVHLEDGLRVRFGPGRYLQWRLLDAPGARRRQRWCRGATGARRVVGACTTTRCLATLRAAGRGVVYFRPPRGSGLPASVQASLGKPHVG